jgi:hypothetical protein
VAARDRERVSIRLAIVGLPRLLSDVIAEVFRDDDVKVDVLTDRELVDGDRLRHEMVIVGVTDPACSPVLDEISRLVRPRVLSVRTDGRESWLYRMQPFPERIGPASPAQIRAAVLADEDSAV